MLARAEEEEEPCPSVPVAGGRLGPVVIIVGDPSLTPTSCNIREGRPCTMPGKHSRTNLLVQVVGEHVRDVPIPHMFCGREHPSPPISIWGRW